MSRTANVDTLKTNGEVQHQLQAHISDAFDSFLTAFCNSTDTSRTSIIRRSVADAIKYVPSEASEIALLSQQAARDAAGAARKRSHEALTTKAREVDMLKSALLNSGGIPPEELIAMLRAQLGV